MPPPLSPGRRRTRRLWRRIRGLAALLPPLGFQWLRHLLWHGTVLPVSRPRTLTHHLFLRMARDRDPRITITSDKLAVRHYVTERLGPGHLPALYAVLDPPEELAALDLPARYVVEATHGGGMTAVVAADHPAERRPVALGMYYPPGPEIPLPPTFDPPEWDARLGALWPRTNGAGDIDR